MAAPYITPATQDILNNEMNRLHATFARPIAIFKTAKETIISTTNDHNFLFQGAPTNDTIQYDVQSGVFMARVLYGKKQDRRAFGGFAGQQPMIELEVGEVRLKLDPTGAAFLAGADRVTVDGNILKVSTSSRPHGLFAPNFYDFYCRKLD